MRTLLWLLTILGSLFGALVGLVGVLGANGAPQEAAAAAIGVACAVIPYCLARAVSELLRGWHV
jgi:ammonia channel protein AmtB